MDYRTLLATAFERTSDDRVAKLSPARLQALQALQVQAEQDDHKLPWHYTSHIRIKGYCSELLELFSNKPAKRAALVIARAGARVDVTFNVQVCCIHL